LLPFEPPPIGARALLSTLTLSWAVMGATGCAPLLRPAPFAGAATKVTGVSLLGPFDGQIVDAETEEPISDAKVFAVWSYDRGDGFSGSDGATTTPITTDEAGRYRIKRPSAHRRGRHRRLTAFTLFVYKRGYVAYRSDMLSTGERRTDFSMRHNNVRLEKWRESFSHAEHLAVLAGPREIRQSSMWAASLANADLYRERGGLDDFRSGSGLTPAGDPDPDSATLPGASTPTRDDRSVTRQPDAPIPRPLLDVSAVLSPEDVQRRTGDDGRLVTVDLNDALKRTPYYHGVALQAEGRDPSFDLSYRVWLNPPGGMTPIRETLKTSLPDAVTSADVTDETLVYEDDAVRVIAFVDGERDLAVLVSCGREQCADIETVILLANLAWRNLLKMDSSTPDGGGS
jgi:hypothetical protein